MFGGGAHPIGVIRGVLNVQVDGRGPQGGGTRGGEDVSEDCARRARWALGQAGPSGDRVGSGPARTDSRVAHVVQCLTSALWIEASRAEVAELRHLC